VPEKAGEYYLDRSCQERESITGGKEYLTQLKTEEDMCICYILRQNGLLKHVTEGMIEGRIEVTERLGRRRKQPVDDIKKTRGYWKLTKKEPDCRLRGTRFGRGCGPVVRQTAA
jgi:hypothetical protein